MDLSKLKAFADDKMNVAKNLKIVLGRVENIVGKGENAENQHFLLFPQCFQNVFFFNVGKSRDYSFPTMFSICFFFKIVKSRDSLIRSYVVEAIIQNVKSCTNCRAIGTY